MFQGTHQPSVTGLWKELLFTFTEFLVFSLASSDRQPGCSRGPGQHFLSTVLVLCCCCQHPHPNTTMPAELIFGDSSANFIPSNVATGSVVYQRLINASCLQAVILTWLFCQGVLVRMCS